MSLTTITVFTVRLGDLPMDSFTTQQFLTEEAALAQARASRDRFNASEYGQANGEPYRITRRYKRSTARPL